MALDVNGKEAHKAAAAAVAKDRAKAQDKTLAHERALLRARKLIEAEEARKAQEQPRGRGKRISDALAKVRKINLDRLT